MIRDILTPVLSLRFDRGIPGKDFCIQSERFIAVNIFEKKNTENHMFDFFHMKEALALDAKILSEDAPVKTQASDRCQVVSNQYPIGS